MKSFYGFLVVAIMAGIFASPASAISQFKTPFKKKYAEKHKSEGFQKAVQKASCNACHVKKAPKKVRNEYGELLAKLIPGDANKRYKDAKKKSPEDGKKEMEKILLELDKAFEKAAETKTEKGKGPKYGEIIKSGKLPVDIDKAAAEYQAKKAKADAAK